MEDDLEPTEAEKEFERKQAITDRIDALETMGNLFLQAVAMNNPLAKAFIWNLRKAVDRGRQQNESAGYLHLLESRAAYLERAVLKRGSGR